MRDGCLRVQFGDPIDSRQKWVEIVIHRNTLYLKFLAAYAPPAEYSSAVVESGELPHCRRCRSWFHNGDYVCKACLKGPLCETCLQDHECDRRMVGMMAAEDEPPGSEAGPPLPAVPEELEESVPAPVAVDDAANLFGEFVED